MVVCFVAVLPIASGDVCAYSVCMKALVPFMQSVFNNWSCSTFVYPVFLHLLTALFILIMHHVSSHWLWILLSISWCHFMLFIAVVSVWH